MDEDERLVSVTGHTAPMTGRTCPYALCLVREAHTHPICPACGAVRYGNIGCDTCRALRGDDLNPHTLVPAEAPSDQPL